jgi:hypothetical protein
LLFTNGTIATLTGTSRILLKAFLQSKFESNSGLVKEMKSEPSSSQLRLDLEFGNLIADVKELNKGSSFTIHSLGIVGIRGTQFRLFSRGEDSYLDVLDGSVDYAGGALDLKEVLSGKRQEAKKVAGKNDPALEVCPAVYTGQKLFDKDPKRYALIVRDLAESKPLRRIAREQRVSPATVSAILRREKGCVEAIQELARGLTTYCARTAPFNSSHLVPPATDS